ncbi:unnamed protein product [Cochlearia groenlandica]
MAKSKNNVSDNQQTQPIDSLPSSSPSNSGEEKDCWLGKCGDEFMQDTVPNEEDALISDEYLETQVIDSECDDEERLLCGETQAVSLGFESQEEEPFDGLASTQVLDCCDDEVVADSDEDGTDVLEGNNEFSDGDELCSKDGFLLSSEEHVQYADEQVESTIGFDAKSSGDGSTGKGARFASIRSAAFRATALAATPKFLQNDCPASPNCHSSGQAATHISCLEYCVREVGNEQCDPSMSVEKKNDLLKGKRTARKLFLEDSPKENCPSAGLSYIDSQEPGEASQASALNFVDKLISESCLEFGLEVEAVCGRRTNEKPKLVGSVKGLQELAKKVSYKSRAVGNDIFDFDDNREDEGGGDICRRKREEFFGAARKARESTTLPREQKRDLIHESLAVDKRCSHSDSRLLLQHSATRSKKKIHAAKKNLSKDLDAVSEDNNNKISDTREVVVVGNDTLCSGDPSKFDADSRCLTGKKLSPGEGRNISNGVVTRQSKGTKRIQAMGKDELLKRRMKKASPSSAKSCGKNIERSSQGNQLDKEGPCSWKRRKLRSASRETQKDHVVESDKVHTESNTRMCDRDEEVEAGPDTQMAAEAISALHFGGVREIDHEPNCRVGKIPSVEEGIVNRKSKRIKGIQAVDSGVESLRPKTKKARSIHSKDMYSKNDKLDTPDEVIVSSTEKRLGDLSNKHCKSKLITQSSGAEAEVQSYAPKGRGSVRILQDQDNVPSFDTPVKSNKRDSKNVSPICMGDEYHRLSRKSNTTREFRRLTSPLVEPIPETKSTRKRRDLSSVRVLFSQHLDEDVTKHQKKILARFDISEASSMTDATHFITNNFMRTRNMLEAIASGKPVVTTQWLESIDQVNIYVDEDLYILRDSKKEKEFGFNMGVSLARARHNPLLQGRRVFITPNTKPGLNTITTLVKAVHGLPIERLGRSVLSEDKVPENLLVLSCEEDRDISVQFLERGAEVYSSELLLNGIVTQKLEYERYRLFADNVRRTRSTIWIRDGKGEFQRRRR